MKILIKLKLSILLLAGIIVSCSNDFEVPKALQHTPTLDTKVELVQALENANDLMKEFETDTKATQRKIATIEALGYKSNTRGETSKV